MGSYVITADRLQLNLSLTSLLSNTITLPEVTLDGAKAHLSKDQGGLNLLEAFEQNSPSPNSWNFVLERLIIKGGSLNLSWEDHFSLKIPQLNQTAQLKIFPNTNYYRILEGDAPNVELFTSSDRWEISQLHLENLNLGGKKLAVDALSATINDKGILGSIHFFKKTRTINGSVRIASNEEQDDFVDLDFKGLLDAIDVQLKAELKLQQTIGKKLKLSSALKINSQSSAQANLISLSGSSDYKIIGANFTEIDQGTFNLHVDGNKQKVTLRSLHLIGQHKTLNASGSLYPVLNTKFSGSIGQFSYRPQPSLEPYAIKDLALSGFLSGPPSNPRISLSASMKQFARDKFNLGNIQTAAELFQKKLDLKSFRAEWLGGGILASGEISFTSKPQFDLKLQVSELSVPLLQVPSLEVVKTADLTFNSRLNGTLANWNLQGNFKIPNLITSVEALGFLSGQFQFENKVLTLGDIQLDGPYMSVLGDHIRYDLEQKEFDGELEALHLDLARLKTHLQLPLEGGARGTINIHLTPKTFTVKSDLRLFDLKAFKIPIGNGPLTVFHDDHWQVAFLLSTPKGESIQAQLAFDNQFNAINLEGNLTNFDIHPWTLSKYSPFVPLRGQISGQINANGTLKNPYLNLFLHTNDLRSEHLIFSTSKRGEINIQSLWQQLGTFEIRLNLSDGKLVADICNFPLPRQSPERCPTDSAIRLHLNGNAKAYDHFDFAYSASLHTDKLTEILQDVHQLATTLQLEGSLSGKIRQRPDEPFKYTGAASLSKFLATAPGIKKLALTEPAVVLFSNEGFSIEKQTEFAFDRGFLKASGKMLNTALDLDLQGHIPLMLTRQFFPGILGAKGALEGSLTIRGSRANPAFSGTLNAIPGAALSFVSLIEPITFRSGKFIFNQKLESTSFSIENLRASVGDGSLNIEGQGSLTKNGDLQAFSASITAQDIVLKSNENWLEGSVKLQASYENGIPKLSGTSDIFDGYFHAFYTFNDLVLSSKTDPTTPHPLGKFFGDNLTLDLETNIDGIDINADLDIFAIRSEIAAKLNFSGTPKNPIVKGALDIMSGDMNFPGAILDIQPTTIAFPGNNTNFNPQIDLIATGSLSEKTSLNNENITISASLKGPLKHMKMDLSASSADKFFDTFQTFLILMQPGSFGTLDAQKSLVSISSSVLASPITGELGKYISTQTNSSFRIGTYFQDSGVATQLQWRLGERIVLEGTAQTSASTFNVSNLKIQLLLFDHLPFGESLFFEGIFLANRQLYTYNEQYSAVRLKYRLLQQ